ncbi:MAG: tRNA (adenosine(37)-N6)-threonylcarbamoyltransferase complex transferase subunit TsaD [Candidatus Liptonbacteria bacterium]|nr:tRNA (adenosine(37)-N6)-threonylcarbamoyltransferase complex transferase subunit TsaD [Candidatus Liptonbacteria bacterium]
MLILGIETSCDDTSLALVSVEHGNHPELVEGSLPRFRVLKNLVSSQIKTHAPFGGVVPNLAKREHTKNLPILLRKILGISNFQFPISKRTQKSKSKIPKIDMIAVTVGPGLEPALWTGIEFAKALAKDLKKPLVGANHLEGHLYSFLLPPQKKTEITNYQLPITKLFPAIQLLVSGGHTILVHMKNLREWKKLGETRDDAVGEAFDKVARLLELPYPGGPEIERLARKGNPDAVAFPRPMATQKNYDFSFSGLKTSVLYYLRDSCRPPHRSSPHMRGGKGGVLADTAASFQQAALDVLVQKTIRAAREYSAKSVILSGGVAANKALRATLRREAKKIGGTFIAPEAEYRTDNAAMIAAAGYMAFLHKRELKKGGLKLKADGCLSL